MIAAIKNFFAKLLTEPDNKTPCVVRIAAFGGFLYAHGVHAYHSLWLHESFDFMTYCGGLSAMLATLGAALGLKKDTQP